MVRKIEFEKFRKLFEVANIGQLFEYEGQKFIKLTETIALELETDKHYFKGLDF